MTSLEPGTYIDSHWGHYQSARTIELARLLGWQPEDTTEVDNLTTAYNIDGTVDDLDVWYDIVREAEDYLNTLCPEGYWFGHHADIGDVGVWEIEDDWLASTRKVT